VNDEKHICMEIEIETIGIGMGKWWCEVERAFCGLGWSEHISADLKIKIIFWFCN
jgi:hypothetical protein